MQEMSLPTKGILKYSSHYLKSEGSSQSKCTHHECADTHVRCPGRRCREAALHSLVCTLKTSDSDIDKRTLETQIERCTSGLFFGKSHNPGLRVSSVSDSA